MTRLVFDKHLGEIRKILAGADKRRLAVAFWGRGAMSELGLDKGTIDTRIICDLMSGACCPDEIRDLIKRFGWKNVKSRDGLHSKIYLTDEAMSIGSSNASSNGLGFEGAETATNLEANVLINDRTLLKDAERKFDIWWVSDKAFPITEELLQEAEAIYKTRRHKRHQIWQSANYLPSIFELWNRSPSSFDDTNVFVFGYDAEKGSEEAKKQNEEDKIKLMLPKGIKYFEIDSSEVFQYARGRLFLDLRYWQRKLIKPVFYQVVDQPKWRSHEIVNTKTLNVYYQRIKTTELPYNTNLSKIDISKILKLLPKAKFRANYGVFCPIKFLLDGSLKNLDKKQLRKIEKEDDAKVLSIVAYDDDGFYECPE
jgi:hypothetical protein